MTDEEINYQTKRIKIEDVASYNKLFLKLYARERCKFFTHPLHQVFLFGATNK